MSKQSDEHDGAGMLKFTLIYALVVFVLTAGDPDLLDALVARLMP